MKQYIDRHDAGKALSVALKAYANNPDTIVLALPRGGVPVAYEVAKSIAIPLDVFIVRKLGIPGQEEFAMGAIAMDGTVIFNNEIINDINISKSAIEDVIQAEEKELKRRVIKYRGDRPFPDLTDKTIILVDDGIATGATMRVAINALRKHTPASIIVAVPVGSQSACEAMAQIADNVICPLTPESFHAVGQWYQDFTQTTDEEVSVLLKNK